MKKYENAQYVSTAVILLFIILLFFNFLMLLHWLASQEGFSIKMATGF
jgi:hypothetical protein